MKYFFLTLITCFYLTGALFSQTFPSDPDKAILHQVWLDLGQPAMNNWDFGSSPNIELDDSWLGVIMTDNGENIKELELISRSGILSPDIGDLEYLTALTTYNCQFTGGIPSELGQLSNLILLSLTNSQLNGSIPAELGQLSQLRFLSLSDNELSGSLPSTLGQLTSMIYFSVLNNQLEGSIPISLSQINGMQIFILANNQLTGSIPAGIGQFQGNPPIVNLSSNLFSGCIPSSFEAYCNNPVANVNLSSNPLLTNDDFSTFCSNGTGECPTEEETHFVTTWQTDLEFAAPTNPTTITIPTHPNETYNFDVDWNDDGTFDEFGLTGEVDVVHDYGTPGVYTVRIRGLFPRIYFNEAYFSADPQKLLSIDQWGDISWSSMENAFSGCFYLSILASDTPDLSGVYSFQRIFKSCPMLNADINNWDVSHVTDMSQAFYQTQNFTSPLDSWNVSMVTDMTSMLTSSGYSTENYDALLLGWVTLDLQQSVNFYVGSTYCLGAEARQSIIDDFNWSIIDDGLDPVCEYCTTFETAPTDLTKSFAPVNGTVDRVQLKWYKASPQVAYTDEDAAACDIKFWPKRDLDPITGNPVGPAYVSPDTVLIEDAKKFLADGVSPKSIFKWPVKFSANGANNTKRVDPNIRYQWKVRCACEHGAGPESPWSVIKTFNTPDFDPSTGISQGAMSQNEAKALNQEMSFELYPNPSEGNEFIIQLESLDIEQSLASLSLFDLQGKEVYKGEYPIKGKDSRIKVKMETPLDQGVYIVKLTLDRNRHTQLLLVE